MKKYLFVFLLILAMSSSVVAQTRPFIGYDKLAWGVSVDDVRAAYELGESIVLVENSGNDPNIAVLTQEKVSDSIGKREFYFNKYNSNGYKLYRVWVYYRNGSDANRDSLRNLLEQRYGRRTNFNIQNGDSGNLFFPEPYTDYVSTFATFAPDIEVQLIQRIGKLNVLGTLLDTSENRVVYTWKKFRDEYQASKLGL
jgi:hypothetical protein